MLHNHVLKLVFVGLFVVISVVCPGKMKLEGAVSFTAENDYGRTTNTSS